MSVKKFAIALLAMTVLAFATMPLVAQTVTTGDLTGTITDQSGAVVTGANVTLKNGDSGTSQSTSTNTNGIYKFSLLAPGEYTLSASAASMAEVSRKVIVAIGQVTNASVQLGVKGEKEVLEVTSDVPLLKTDNANISTGYNNHQLQDLPNPGNDITQFAQTAPGVLMNTAGGIGNFTAFGLPATANLFTINGADEMDPYFNVNNSGATNLLLGASELQEITVVSNGYTGQYGRQAGAQVDAVTKAGTNTWHGGLRYWWNGSSLNANDWFNNNTGTPIGFANNNQYGAEIGGPIKKDKLFVYANTEGLRFILGGAGPVVLPSAAFQNAILADLAAGPNANEVPFYKSMFNLYNGAPGASRAVPITNAVDSSGNLGCGSLASTVGGVAFGPGAGPGGSDVPCATFFRSNAPSAATEWLVSTRVDYVIGEKDKLFGRYKTDHGNQPSGTDGINPLFNAVSNQPQHEGQLNETHVFTPNLINQFVLTGNWYSAFFLTPNRTAALAAFPFELDDLDATFTSLGGGGTPINGGGGGGGDYNFPQGRNVTQYGVVDDLAWTHGNHAFKFGVNYRRNDITDGLFGRNTIPRMVILSVDDFAHGFIDRVQERFNVANEQPAAIYSLGAYLQDEWRVSSNLKFTMALRVDRNSNMVCQHDCIARLTDGFNTVGHDVNVPYNQVIVNNQHQLFDNLEKVVVEPRFGFAWTPFGSKSTVLRGGIGLFPDLYPGTLFDTFALNAPQSTSFTVTFPTGQPFAPGVAGNAAGVIATCNAAFQSAFLSGGNLATFKANAGAVPCATPNFNAVANNVRNPKYTEWNLEIEQGIGSRTVVTANYVGNHGYDLFMRNAGLNTFCNPATTCAGGATFAGVPTSVPDGRFTNVINYDNSGYSNYNGLVFGVTQRLTYGFSGSFNYTWSHSLDTVSNGGIIAYSATDTIRPQINPFRLRSSYASSDYDVRHNITASYVWDLPFKSSNNWMNYLVGGWNISGTFFHRSGYPFSVSNSKGSSTLLRNFSNSTLLADVLTASPNSCTGGPSLDPNAPACLLKAQFGSATAQRDFPAARNFFRGPGYFDTDVSVNKTFKLTERFNFIAGMNVFNVLNHPNFATPNSDLPTGMGAFSSTVAPPTNPYGSFLTSAVSGRIVQLSGKLIF
jgi:hypothetical protein